jgi:hypothetical protein
MDVLSVLRNEMEAPKDLRNKALLLAASIIDMVHGTKKKVDYSLQRKFFHQEKHIRSSLRYARPKAVLGNLNLPSIKKILKPRNQVLSLKLTIEDLQKLQNWLVHHTIVKQECYLKHL